MRHDCCGTVLWIFEDMMGAADADQPPTLTFETADDVAAVSEHWMLLQIEFRASLIDLAWILIAISRNLDPLTDYQRRSRLSY
jgi:hypothetical protein